MINKAYLFNKDGFQKAEIKKLTYSGTFMGERFITVDISSPAPIDFQIGDYTIYRGEIFELNTTPTVTKSARTGSRGDAYKYESVKFNSLADELVRCKFLDKVLNDNELHYTGLPVFSFYCETILELANRIQANLDKLYSGNKRWTIKVNSEFVSKTRVPISVSNINCWDALALCKSEFDANFIIRGRQITIGTEGIAVGKVFQYGKDKGLLSLQRIADQDQAVITRLRVYGSTKNLPNRYYAQKNPNLPSNLAVRNLMLPDFGKDGNFDPYLESENAAIIGIREESVFFDGSDGREDIHPTIEGMTAEQLTAAGLPCSSTGELDVVVSAEQISDSGIFGDNENVSGFKVTVKDLGFDLNEYLTESSATMSMKNGKCGSRDFEVVRCTKNTDGTYTFDCNRQKDDDLDLYFPNKDYNISSGDKFVLLNITMPDQYVIAASQRLKEAGEAYLAANDYVRYTYKPEIDNIFIRREYDSNTNKAKSIYWSITEGDIMLFNDTDLQVEGSVFIDTLTIREGESPIPQIEVALRNDKAVGFIERVQNAIDSFSSFASRGSSGAGGGMSTAQVRSLIKAICDNAYLSKINDDTVEGNITFNGDVLFQNEIQAKGVRVDNSVYSRNYGNNSSGFMLGRYGNTPDSYLEVDRLYVRKVAEFVELQIQKLSHVGGQIELSPCASTIESVEAQEDGSFKCYLLLEDGSRSITNDWVVGDQAKCQTFNLGELSNKYYWRLVSEVGDDYIVLSLNDCDVSSAYPEKGDVIVQSGNRTDVTRQNVIMLSAHGSSSPSISQYMGIDSYTLLDKEVMFMGYDDAVKSVINRTYGQFYVGDRDAENGSFIHYTPDGGVEMRATKFSLKVKNDSGEEKYEELDKIISQIGGQDDGSFLVWRTDSLDEPNEYSEPTTQWTTDEERGEHIGDIYLNADGMCWEYTFVDGVGFYWKPVTDKYLIQCVNRIETKARVFTGVYGSTTPTTGEYHVNDMWVDATFGTQYVKDMLVCIKAGSWESFKIEDWKPSNRFSEALSNFINGDYKEFVDQMQQREDRYAETFYQSEDPSLLWETAEERIKHIGDIWYDTANKSSKIYNGSGWDTSDVDLSGITDKIDGKAKIFVAKPNTPITTDENYCYRVNDLWIVESDSVISGYKKGELLVALQSSTVYNASHWSRKLSYTDGMNDTEKQNLSETGIDIQKKEITLTAGKTLIRSNNNTTIAMFTLKNGIPYFKTSLIDADEININVVKSFDKNGTLLSAYNGNGNGTIIYYYPNGSVMKEDVWLKDANGNTTGIRQIYYMANGEVAWYIDQNGFQSRLQEYWKDAGIWGFVLSAGYNEGGATIQQKAQAIASYVALHYSAWIPIEDTDNLSWWETFVGSTTYNEYQGLAIKGNIDSGEVPHDGMRGTFTGWALQGSVSGGKIYPYEFYLDDEDTAYVGFYAVYYSNSRLQAYYYITTDGHVYDVPNSRMAR